MTLVYGGVGLLLFVSLLLGLVRVWHGPSVADRMLAAQLFSTTGVALLLVLTEAMDAVALRDVALLLALLAAVAVVALVTRAWTASGGPDA